MYFDSPDGAFFYASACPNYTQAHAARQTVKLWHGSKRLMNAVRKMNTTGGTRARSADWQVEQEEKTGYSDLRRIDEGS